MYGVFPLFPAMKGLFMSSVSETVSTSQGELEKLVGDLRGLLASRDLDGIPEIKQLRQRLDDGIQTVRDATVRAAQQAADQARDAARAADRYAHDEPWRVIKEQL